MTLKYEVQGHPRSNVKMDLNSQHMSSCLLPVKTMALSVTVFEIFNIFICMENPILTPNFGGFWSERPQNVEVENFDPTKHHLSANPRVLSYFALIWSAAFGLGAR